jgi:muconate cycloisomerase
MIMTHPKIEKIELTPIFVPFKTYVTKAMEESEGGLGMAISSEEKWLGGDFVICELFSNTGDIGLGESFIWLPETGISANQIIDSIENGLAKYILGENPFNIEKINHRMDINIARSEVAKGLLDMACYDLMGSIAGVPACFLMGGKNSEEIPLAALIPLGDPMLMKGLVRSYFKKGFRTFRLKLGKSPEEDYEIVSSIKKTFADRIRIRIDYNQAYTPSKAIQALKLLEPFNIDFAEQPVAAYDYLGMAHIQKRVSIPLMSHEGFFSLKDLVTLIKLNAIGVVGLNSERPGGVTKAKIALNYAKMNGIEVVLHNQPLGIASAMHVHFHSAYYYEIDHPTELFGQEMLQDDLIIDPLNYHDGKVDVPEGVGWGVKLDEKALQRFATDDTTTCEL